MASRKKRSGLNVLTVKFHQLPRDEAPFKPAPSDVHPMLAQTFEILGLTEDFTDAIGKRIGLTQGDAFAVIEEMGAHHPDEPHWYLPVIGTCPDGQGQGHGALLLRPVLEICDRTGVPAYLEATTTRNRALYARHGFDATAEIRVAGCPPLTAMVRSPR